MAERAIQIHETGGPEVLALEDIEVGRPGAGEVRIRHTAIGLNMVDTYQRSGLYQVPLPTVLGNEAAGIVEELGPDVNEFAVGDRVAYALPPIGAYSTARIYPADKLVKIPDGVSDEDAAAVTLKGLTAWYLLRRIHRASAGETILLHAAAGGLGLIATQWAAHLGVRVIGTVGSPEKAQAALDAGAVEVIQYRTEDIAARVRDLTDGVGVPVAYDSVGAATYVASLDSLQRRGLLVLFGNASGPVSALDTALLAAKGSLFVTRPTLAHYVAERSELEEGAAELFDLVARGVIKANVGQRFKLSETAAAHAALQARSTTGSTVLLP